MNTAINIQNLLDSIDTLSTEDRTLLVQKLQHTKEDISSDNSWIKYAGMYENNPLFDEVLDDIEKYRQEIDLQNNFEEIGN